MAQKLNPLQKSQIKGWLQEESYNAVFQLLQNRIEELNNEEIVGNSEFETLRALHKNQARKEELVGFFDKLDRSAYE